MKPRTLVCVALFGLAGLAAASCSKMDRSAPASAEPPAIQNLESKEEAKKKNGLKADEWRGEGEADGERAEDGRMGKRDPVARGMRFGVQNEPGPVEADKRPEDRGDLAQVAPAAAVPMAPPPPPRPKPARKPASSVEDPFGQADDAPAATADLRLLAKEATGKDLVDRPPAGAKTATIAAGPTAGLVDGQSGEQAKEEETVEKPAEEPAEKAIDGSRGDAEADRFDVDLKARRKLKPEPEEARPEHFLPRMFYFENTYLGGNAAFTRRLLALDQAWPGGEKPYARAAGPRQPFDAPGAAGLGLTVNVDRSHFEKPGRVYLQIGLQGSPRFGWRRPPLDLVLVVDAAVLGQAREAVDEIAREALRRLEPTDRLAIVVAGESPRMLLDLAGPRDLRTQMARTLDALPTSVEAGTPGALGTAIRLAGARLQAAAGNEARVPGAQEVLVLARGADGDRVPPAAEAAHEIGVAGVITSVVRFDAAGEAGAASTLAFWDIAQAGQGNLRAVDFGAPASGVITAELADLSRVVARLIRVNVRLGGRVEAIRVLGSRMLARDEVVRVKAREEAVDRNLSKTLGVKADRGADDDGVQTVIPYFYGGDAHVMALELWVDGPGLVADVSLKYKDMVNLGNATSRASVALSSTPRPRTGAEVMVQRNIDAFRAAETLAEAARRLDAGDAEGALALVAGVEQSSGLGAAGVVAREFGQVLRTGGDPALQSEALRLAAARTVGVFAGAP